MVKYLLDTNTISHFFRGDSGVAVQLMIQSRAEVGVPAPAIFEVHAAIRSLARDGQNQDRQQQMADAVDQLVQTLTVVSFDAQAAREAARIHGGITRRPSALGPIGVIDTQVAGIAIAIGATLVTNKTVLLRRISGLKLENWCLGYRRA